MTEMVANGRGAVERRSTQKYVEQNQLLTAPTTGVVRFRTDPLCNDFKHLGPILGARVVAEVRDG